MQPVTCVQILGSLRHSSIFLRRGFHRPHSHAQLCQNVRTASGRAKGRKGELSRKEKRALTKELKRKARNDAVAADPAPPPPSFADRLGRFTPRRFFPQPKTPGGTFYFTRQDFVAIGKRIPLWLLLVYLSVSDDTSPLVMDKARGPSMLPTIFPIGDVYLRATHVWHRIFDKSYQVGDLVTIRNPVGDGYSCKRIVGMEGDTVLRYGQFAHMYKDREDFGIITPPQFSIDGSWDHTKDHHRQDDISRTLVVPSGHVWVEGDFPPLSLDSRHYGPVLTKDIRGRLLLRLWPLWRREGARPSPILASRQRPVPLTMDEALGGDYNLTAEK